MQKNLLKAVSTDILKKRFLGYKISSSELWALLIVQVSLTGCAITWEMPYSVRVEVCPDLCLVSDRESCYCCFRATELSNLLSHFCHNFCHSGHAFCVGVLEVVPLPIPFSVWLSNFNLWICLIPYWSCCCSLPAQSPVTGMKVCM